MKKIILSSFCILLFWAVFVPSLEYPDEQAHFASVSLLSETGSMPKGDQQDVSLELATLETILGTRRDDRGNNSFTYHPEAKHDFSADLYGPGEQTILEWNTPSARKTYAFKEGARYPFLFYQYSGIFYKSVFEKSILDRLFAVRFGVVLLGVFQVFISYKISREITQNQVQSKAIALLVSLHPMMTFIMSGVNSDSLHIIWVSLISLYSLRLIKYRYAGDTIFYLGLFFVLDMFTKPQAMINIPIIGTALILRSMFQKEVVSSIKYLFTFSLLGFSYLYITKNPMLLNFIQKGELPYIHSRIHPDAPSFIEYANYSLDRLLRQNIVWFWGVFKWLGVVLPKPFWWIANRLVLISALGIGYGMFKKFDQKQKHMIVFLIASVLIYMLSIFWFDWMYVRANGIQVAVQARYYFPVFVSLMTIFYMGLLAFFTNKKHEAIVTKVIVLFFVCLQLAGIYTIAKSYYDLSSVTTLFLQAGQYKPLFAKGHTWWVWGSMYLFGIATIIYTTVKLDQAESKSA